MKTNQIEILELRSTINEKFTRGIQEEIWEGTKRIGKFHDRSNEISQSDDQKEKIIRDPWDTLKYTNITHNGSQERRAKAEILEETMAENLPYLMKESTH